MTPDKRAQLYMVGAHMGAVATAILIPARALAWPDFIQGFALGLLLVAIVMLLRRKLRDEYIEELWASGTTYAFIALLFWYVLAPFGEGFIDGFFNLPNRSDIPVNWTGLVALAAFFIGFHIKWLRSRL